MISATRQHSISILLLGALAYSVAGCATYGVGDVWRGAPARHGDYRVDQDVRRYMRNVDRRVRLNRRQEQWVYQMLRERTYRLLDRARPVNHRHVYPFPRRDYWRMNSVQRDFWRDADRRIERNLTRAQVRRYRGAVTRESVYVQPYADRRAPRRSSRIERRDNREDNRGWRSGRQWERDADRDGRSRRRSDHDGGRNWNDRDADRDRDDRSRGVDRDRDDRRRDDRGRDDRD